MKPSWVIASWSPPRVLKIAPLSLSLILSVAVSAYAQAQQPQRPASRDAARSGPTQNFIALLNETPQKLVVLGAAFDTDDMLRRSLGLDELVAGSLLYTSDRSAAWQRPPAVTNWPCTTNW